MPRNRKLVLAFLVIVTLVFSFMVYIGLEKDIIDVEHEHEEEFEGECPVHGHHHHHEDDDDPGMQFYTLDILNHPWNNPHYRANLYIQTLLILFVDLVFLTFIYILDKPRHFREEQKNDG